MSKKLYYTDPLAAAYMAREFGVEITSVHGEFKFTFKEMICECKQVYCKNLTLSHFAHLPSDTERYYIHPDSYHIFEPMVGDLVSINGGETASLVTHPEMVGVILANKDRFVSTVKIIQRAGKPFFNPREE